MRRPYDIERRGICLLRRGSLFCGLGNSDVKGLVQQIVNDRLAEAFEEDPTTARKIADKCVRAAQAREAARKARELTRKGGREHLWRPGPAKRPLPPNVKNRFSFLGSR